MSLGVGAGVPVFFGLSLARFFFSFTFNPSTVSPDALASGLALPPVALLAEEFFKGSRALLGTVSVLLPFGTAALLFAFFGVSLFSSGSIIGS